VSQAVQQYVGDNIKSDEVLRARVLAHPHLIGLLQTHVDSVTVAAANATASATAAAGAGTFYGSEVVSKAQMHVELKAERAGALDKARQVLNNMMKETAEQKDMTNEQCDRYRDETQEQLDLAHQGKAQCEAASAKATSGLNQAKATTDASSEKLEELKSSFDKEKRQCAEDIKALKTQLDLVRQDESTAKKVIDNTKCASKKPDKPEALIEVSKCTAGEEDSVDSEETDEGEGEGGEGEDENFAVPSGSSALLQSLQTLKAVRGHATKIIAKHGVSAKARGELSLMMMQSETHRALNHLQSATAQNSLQQVMDHLSASESVENQASYGELDNDEVGASDASFGESADEEDDDDEDSDEEEEMSENQMFKLVENQDENEANNYGSNDAEAELDAGAGSVEGDDSGSGEENFEQQDTEDEQDQQSVAPSQGAAFLQAAASDEAANGDATDVSTYFIQTLAQRRKHSHKIHKNHNSRGKKARAHQRRMQALTTSHSHKHHAEQKVITLNKGDHRHRHSHKKRKLSVGSHKKQHVHKSALLQREAAPEKNNTDPVMSGPTVNGLKKQGRKCSMAKTPNCQKFMDAMLTMSSEIDDAIASLEAQISKTDTNCRKVEEGFEEQIRDQEQVYNAANTEVATHTSALTESMESCRLRDEEIVSLTKQYNDKMSQCKAELDTHNENECGLRKMRADLLKMSGASAGVTPIQDCEVSAWVKGQCSNQCGGGTQSLTRTIVTPPYLGAACPPLLAERSCNTRKCPVDCKMSSFSGWSKCTAQCGGGVKTRTREVIREAKHGGMPCGATTLTARCNTQSCDRPCVLSRWTKWSGCSKGCGGGYRRRYKRILKRARGNGKCPRWAQRRQYKRCNTRKCKPKTVKCASKLDLMILIDGSGSLGKKNFALQQKAWSKFVKSLKMGEDTGVKVGAVLVGGPKTWWDFIWCKKGYQKHCNVQVLSQMTTDNNKVASLIEGAKYPSSTFALAAGISTAATVLNSGRSSAQSVVLALSDGRPLSPRNVRAATRRLRRKARVTWIPVKNYRMIRKIKKWVSKPLKENIYPVRNFVKLEKHIEKLIPNICPITE
jgi:hypothetical protein